MSKSEFYYQNKIGLSYTGLAMHPNNQYLFLISTEKAIRQFEFQTSSEYKASIKPNFQAKLQRKIDTKHTENVTCLHMNTSGKLLCIGTSKGSIRIFRLPEGDSKEYRAHSNSITKICITCNDEYLIASSEDGTLIFWHINEELRTPNVTHQFNDEILIDKNACLKTLKEIQVNESQIKDFQIETDFVCMLKELHSTIKKNDLSKRLNQQLKEVKFKIDSVSAEKETTANRFDMSLKELKKDQMDKIQNIFESFEIRINFENEKNTKLIDEILYLQEQIKTNKASLDEVQLINEQSQFMHIEKKLDVKRKYFSDKIASYEGQIKNLIDYDSDFKEEISNETFKLESDYFKNLAQQKLVNDGLKIEDVCLNNEIKLAEESIQLFKRNFLESEEKLKNLIKKSQELDLAEQNLADQLILDEKNLSELEEKLKALNDECEKIEALNLNHENNLEAEYNQICLENEKLQVVKKEIEKEIKIKKNELSNLKSRVNNHRLKRKSK